MTPATLTILGATGSVGRQTIDLIQRAPERFQVVALTAHRRAEDLAAAARATRARFAAVADPDAYAALRDALSGSQVEAAAGPQAVVAAAEMAADFVMAAIVGAAGLPATLAAARRGARIGLANKESLVCAGDLFAAAAAHCGAVLLPVDSEHNAIFQVFERDHADAVERIILTASGGPFRDRDRGELTEVTPAQAVAHPNWDMGAKISVDSATMMNKGLETIEAWRLFAVEKDQIEVLIHPQSVVHSMVAYRDGSVLAQMGAPDMRAPIAYCLAWPERMATPVARLDLARIGALMFAAPDETRFPALRLAREALHAGGAAPVVLNAANEVAVDAFLNRRLRYLAITDVVAATLEGYDPCAPVDLDDVLALDREARRRAEVMCAAR